MTIAAKAMAERRPQPGVRSTGRGCSYFDPEYDTLQSRLNAPSIVVDNTSCEDATLVKVDVAKKHSILLDVVQILTDLELIISKAYISSDGGWFMNVFHVTDQTRKKLTDKTVIEYIQESLGVSKTTQVRTCLGRKVGGDSKTVHTAIELSGRDRPGLLSDISAVLTGLMCNVVAAEVWTHNMRVACVVYVTDEATGGPVEDCDKLSTIKQRLSDLLKVDDDSSVPKTDFSLGLTHTERRLHQMMLADRDYERKYLLPPAKLSADERPLITLKNCTEKGYSLVSVRCRDRPKLLFDTLCTLTDMQYVVFHASASSDGGRLAFQEYYVRHVDGGTLDLDVEREAVVRCLEAAIERREPEGLRLELCTGDRVGLLSEVTRVFSANGLSVTRADVSTQGDKAVNVFYVTDASGRPVSMKVVEALRQQIGQTMLQVKHSSLEEAKKGPSHSSSFAERFLHSLGLI